MVEEKDVSLRSVYRKGYKLHGIGLVSFNGGIQRSKKIYFCSRHSGWLNTHYAKCIHDLTERHGLLRYE